MMVNNNNDMGVLKKIRMIIIIIYPSRRERMRKLMVMGIIMILINK